jgi:hypothetical protein
MSPRRVLVTGSRDWPDKAPIYRALYFQRIIAGDDGMIVVHGACPTGADAIADHWAHHFYPDHVKAEPHPANWDLGKKAGPLRNQAMVDLGADICLGFPMPSSRGTYDCMQRARAAGIQVTEIPGLWPAELQNPQHAGRIQL